MCMLALSCRATVRNVKILNRHEPYALEPCMNISYNLVMPTLLLLLQRSVEKRYPISYVHEKGAGHHCTQEECVAIQSSCRTAETTQA